MHKYGVGNKDLVKFAKENWYWITPLSYIYVSTFGIIDAWHRFNAFGINVLEFSEPSDLFMSAFREPKYFGSLLLFVLLGFLYYLGARFYDPKVSSSTWRWIRETILYNRLYLIFRSSRRNVSRHEDQMIHTHTHTITFHIRHSIAKFFHLQDEDIDSVYRRRLREVRSKFRKVVSAIYTLSSALLILAAPYIVPAYSAKYDEKWKSIFMYNPRNQVAVTLASAEDNKGKSEEMSDVILVGSTSKYVFFYKKDEKSFIITPLRNVAAIEQAAQRPRLKW